MDYSKGEWKTYESPFAPAVVIEGKPNQSRRIIAVCRLERGSEDMAEATANAYLTSAAPNMEQVLRGIPEPIYVNEPGKEPLVMIPYKLYKEWDNKREQALVKAEGK